MKQKRVVITIIAILIFIGSLPYSAYVHAAGLTLPTYPDGDNKNIHYFVGLGYHDIWQRSNGQWTSDGYPGSPSNTTWDYEFYFPNRVIKSVKVEPFIYSALDSRVKVNTDVDGNGLKNIEDIFFTSRYKQLHYRDFVYKMVLNNTFTAGKITGIESGLGTDNVSGQVKVNGVLNASRPEQLTPGADKDPSLVGLRHYFPIFYTIEIEPEGGTAEIRHYTTTGQSLNGVAGFTDKTKDLIVGTNYSFTHTSGTVDYVYKGYKKSTVSTPSGGSVVTGDPPALNPYDGSFPVYYINYYYETNAPPPPDAECTISAPGQSVSGKYMDPVVTAMIRADARGSEPFDVLQGIPTSESLYGNVFARNYLYQNEFVQMTGKCTFSVNVTKEYTLTWDPGQPSKDAQGKPITIPDPQRETESKTYQYKIERPYSYWTIENLEIYKIDHATLVNYALPNSGIVIQPNGYTTPYYSASTHGNYYPPAPPDEVQAPGETRSGGKTKPNIPDDQSSLKSNAEKVVDKVEVENDYLQFNGQTIMNNQRVKESGSTPGQIPAPQQIMSNVLYSPNHLISSSKVNKRDTPSSGTIHYGLMPGNINGGTDQQFAIHGINTVTVHTPVVNYSSVTDDRAHNQKTTPSPNRAAFILDRPFTVRIPTSGQHVNYPGYGNRDYSKYIMTKQVYFPFDVYNSNQTLFIPKKTWIDVPIHQLDTTFFLPVWVDEGDYTVYFRTIAENSPTQLVTQPDANLNLVNHVATDEVSVEVIGRIYDFHVTDIADYNWETVFRMKKGDFTPRGVSYWVGNKSIDGAPRGNLSPYLLPIAPGSHPQQGYKNVSVKTGYHFKFDLKTKGNMFGLQDGIDITPSFYYVSKDGKTRQSVDLYYNSGSKTMIKIGSTQDTVKRYVILNERLRNVPQQELMNTATYRYNHDALAQKEGSSSQFTEKYTNTLTKGKTWVGSYSALTLSSHIRTLIGPTANIPNGVDQERANASIQHWYGEYSIPADVYAVKKGTNVAEYARTKGLDDHSSIFLKNGYIVVNFDLETLQNGDLSHPHLQYIHAPLMNQWQMEGFNRTYTDPKGQTFILQDGDVVFYHANLSSRDDFDSQVPH